MKRLYPFILAGLCAAAALTACRKAPDTATLHLLVGTYTSSSESKGVYLFDFDPGDCTSALIDTADAVNPSFIVPSEDRFFAYAVSETTDGSQGVYSFKLRDQLIDKLNFRPGCGGAPCNIVIADGSVITSDYIGGTLSVFPIMGDGSLDSMSFQFTPELRGEQTVPHIHCTAVSPDGNYIFTTDLGSNVIYRASLKGQNLPPWDFKVAYSFDQQENPGPRHLIFTADGKFAYLISEKGDCVSVFKYSDGELEHLSTQTAYDGQGHGSADIHISPDGKFLYTSHRLIEDGISIFKRNLRTGGLTKVGFCPTGKHPRNFAITPDGKLLLCACRDEGRIEIYRIEPKTGLIHYTGKSIEVPAPVCIQIL